MLKNRPVLEALQEYLDAEFRLAPEEVRLDSDLKQDFGFDSLDLIELVMFIEDEYGIEITDDEAENYSTVQQLINLVELKCSI